MAEVKDLFSKLIDQGIKTSQYEKGNARVINVKEDLNLCDIIYKDSSSRSVSKENVFVKSSNIDKWFPKIGDLVDIEMFEDEVSIVGRAETESSFLKMKKESVLKHDIYHDDDDCTIGNVLF